MSFLFIGGVMKRFFNYLETMAKRTIFGADGTTYHRSGIAGFILDALEGVIGFFGLVFVGCTLVMLGHWIGLW